MTAAPLPEAARAAATDTFHSYSRSVSLRLALSSKASAYPPRASESEAPPRRYNREPARLGMWARATAGAQNRSEAASQSATQRLHARARAF